MPNSMADRHEAVPTISLERLAGADHGAFRSNQAPVTVLVEGFTSRLAIVSRLLNQANLLQ